VQVFPHPLPQLDDVELEPVSVFQAMADAAEVPDNPTPNITTPPRINFFIIFIFLVVTEQF
jgi:hypothetical protein